MPSWYYKVLGDEMGPISGKELRTLALSRTIQPDTFVRKGVDGEWVTADRVKRLFDPPTDDEIVTVSRQPSQDSDSVTDEVKDSTPDPSSCPSIVAILAELGAWLLLIRGTPLVYVPSVVATLLGIAIIAVVSLTRSMSMVVTASLIGTTLGITLVYALECVFLWGVVKLSNATNDIDAFDAMEAVYRIVKWKFWMSVVVLLASSEPELFELASGAWVIVYATAPPLIYSDLTGSTYRRAFLLNCPVWVISIGVAKQFT